MIRKADEHPCIPPIAAKVAEQLQPIGIFLNIIQSGHIDDGTISFIPMQQSQDFLLKPDRVDFRFEKNRYHFIFSNRSEQVHSIEVLTSSQSIVPAKPLAQRGRARIQSDE